MRMMNRRLLAGITSVLLIWAAGGCSGDGKAATGDDIQTLTTSRDGQERLAASKRLAAQGESAIPSIVAAFGQSEGNAEAQLALADALFRMPTSPAQVSALEKLAEQAKDKQVGEQIRSFAQQRKLAR